MGAASSLWALVGPDRPGPYGIAGLPGVTLQAPAAAAKAMQWMGRGIDFADAMHLALAQSCDAFVTFDRAFARNGRTLGDIEVRLP